jgi:hypothetical protein
MKRVFAVVVALMFTILIGVAADNCATCGNRIIGTIYTFKPRGQSERVFLCEKCTKSEMRCYVCNLPVSDMSRQLIDGRSLCTTHHKQAVFTQDQATDLFDGVKRDVQSMLSQMGPLPHQNITLKLEAKARLDSTGGNIISGHDDSLLMGLTRTYRKPAGDFSHEIYLLYGLTSARMVAVSAHEYGHAWVHENVKRTLRKDTHEGFCEFLAYKVLAQKRETEETKVLLESNYSQGQLQAFIAAEKEYGFYRVIEWMKKGVDTELDMDHLANLLVLRDGKSFASELSTDPNALFASMPSVPRSNPTNLVLKGLSGSANRRFAMINDSTFMAQEKAKVRLGDSNVTVTCLQIGKDSVVVQVAGEPQPRTLLLKN